MIRITLRGCPPSLNRFAGRTNSWEYRRAKADWTARVIYSVRALPNRPREPYAHADVEIMYYFPTQGRHDPDNYAGKFLLDGLTSKSGAGVIVDDDMAHIRLHVAGGYDRREPRTIITVKEIET